MKGAFVIVCCIALIFFCSYSSAIKRSPGSAVTNSTLEEILRSQFPAFANVVERVNPALWAQISNSSSTNPAGYFTVFAPTNQAINDTKDFTPNALAYHVHPGDAGVTQILNFTTLYTLFIEPALGNQSQPLAFTMVNGTVVINGNVNMVDADIIATNGIVHSVSNVIALPSQTVGERLNKDFPTLTALLARVNASLANDDITLLAPTEDAFSALFSTNPVLKPYFLNTNYNTTFDNIRSILNAHVVTKAFYPSYLSVGPNTFQTLAGSNIVINRPNLTALANITVLNSDGSVAANVVSPNMLAANGVVHSISSVLVPSTFSFNLLDLLQTVNATSFIDAVNRFNLGFLLAEETPRTIFVPSNSALASLKNVTRDVAVYHVSSVNNASFTNSFAQSLLQLNLSLNGNYQQLYLSGTPVNGTVQDRRVNGITVTGPFYTSSKNTVVYTIDTALQPPVSALPSLTASNFTDFVGLLTEKQFQNQNFFNLGSPSTTLFAPTNAAFDKLAPGVIGFLRLNTSNENEQKIASALINNHVVPNNLVYGFANANTSLATANVPERLDIINVGKNGPTIVTNKGNINIVGSPVLLENGVAHPIDQLILPSNVGFNAVDLLLGIGADNGNDDWGSYNSFVAALRLTGLAHIMEDEKTSFTLFPPSDAAWSAATEHFDFNAIHQNDSETIIRITEILNYHIIYNEDIVQLNASSVYKVGNYTNNTLTVDDDGEVTLNIAGQEGDQGTAHVLVNTTTTYGQRIYGLNRVLGVGVNNKGGKGLSTLEWILIGVGGAVLGLIILLIVAGAAYYLLVRPKSGYRKIN